MINIIAQDYSNVQNAKSIIYLSFGNVMGISLKLLLKSEIIFAQSSAKSPTHFLIIVTNYSPKPVLDVRPSTIPI